MRNSEDRKKRALVEYESDPREIMCRMFNCMSVELYNNVTYKAIREHVKNSKASYAQWDEYRKKIDPALREIMAELWMECRRNGFFGPMVRTIEGREVITWRQLSTSRTEKTPAELDCTLCELCERECKKKDFNGVMRAGEIPCWHQSESPPKVTYEAVGGKTTLF